MWISVRAPSRPHGSTTTTRLGSERHAPQEPAPIRGRLFSFEDTLLGRPSGLSRDRHRLYLASDPFRRPVPSLERAASSPRSGAVSFGAEMLAASDSFTLS